ncbi:MAG: esterase [Acidobacteriaceae bacterium]|nr:esterase [Acidobacteriaceae bacterium]MBV9780663.1 esterase [Acidobacteriaceae bacterium]
MKTILLSLIAIGIAFAQHEAPLHSPDVQADGRVTFRFRAPNAQHVSLNLADAKQPYVMQKDNEGVWVVTTEALAPDFYGYSFEVDSVHSLDPYDPHIIPNLLNPSDEMRVPGPSPAPWDLTDIPHGTVNHHFYRSSIVGDDRGFYVYTPPGYDPAAKNLYPVLYLLHGYSDDARAWAVVGRANLILDSLIAEHKAKPMIIVMPLGYGAPEIVQHTAVFGAPFSHAELREKNFSKFRQALIEEVIPRVEKSYKIKPDRASRAIAGLSMGGAESLLTGLNRLDKFAWVGAFSSGGLDDNFASDFPNLSSAANEQLRLLWISCGTDDHLIGLNRNLIAWLKSKEIRVTQIETPGMHSWSVWRRNLVALAPLLFTDSR